MFIRIVQMTFKDDTIQLFLDFIQKYVQQIRASEGCTHLKILRDQQNPNIIFTYSHWDAPQYLEQYRHSDLFQSVWAQTKQWFGDKPRAWSVDKLHDLA